MLDFHKRYRPVTATPFVRDLTHAEYQPCALLRPYIRCFWGSAGSYTAQQTPKQLIIPDSCMDLIFNLDETENCLTGKFCGIDNTPFYSLGQPAGHRISTFAIRFYPWAAVLFSDDSMQGVKNRFYDARSHFSKLTEQLLPVLYEHDTIQKRIQAAEKLLLQRLDLSRLQPDVLQAVHLILCRKGNLNIKSLAGEVLCSSRQLQRLFQESLGLSPKAFASLVRYQSLWADVLQTETFDGLEASFQYGYTDQAHLLRDFKKYHGMTPHQAREKAVQSCRFFTSGRDDLLVN